MKKQIKRRKKISAISRNYLCRNIWFLYLYSPEFRRDFARLTLFPPKLEKKKKHLFKRLTQSIENGLKSTRSKILFFYRHSVTAHIAVAIVVFSLFSVAVQLIYPKDRVLPFSRLQANGYVGFSKKQRIEELLRDFDTRKVTVHTHNKDLTTSYTDLGVGINPEKTFYQLSEYSISERLIPFSIFISGNHLTEIDRTIDQSQLELYVRDIVAERDKDPIDAQIIKSGDKILVKKAEEGYRYEMSTLQSKILRSDLSNNSTIIFEPTVLHPRISTYAANDKANMLQARIDTPIDVLAGEKTYKISSSQISSWVKLQPNPANQTIDVLFDKSKIKQAISPIKSEIDLPSTPTKITLLNGTEAGRVNGQPGNSLDEKELIEKLSEAKSASTRAIQATVNTILPKEILERKYTNDSLGLQTLLNYWTQNHSGEFGIDVRTLDGRTSASVNSDRIYSAVGVYRIYIAHLVQGKISAGSLSKSSSTSAGSVSYCLDSMLRSSDYACTEALGNIIGWSSLDSMLHDQGFSNTSLAHNAAVTTANDAASWVIKLYNRSLTNYSQSQEILKLLSSSSERSGIPTGSYGISVSNKAGYYGRIHNDVALVNHPYGPYALAILSEGASYAEIADLAREINAVFNQ